MNKKILGIIALLVVIIAGVFIWKSQTKVASQQASVAGIQAGTQFACQLQIGSNGLPLPQTPVLQVLSPNGGEVFAPSQAVLLKWGKCGIPANAHIEVSIVHSNVQQPGFPGQTVGIGNALGTWILNDGQESVVLPNAAGFAALGTTPTSGGLVYGNYYKLLIKYLNPTTGAVLAQDLSNNWFTVNASSDAIFPSAVSSGQIATAITGVNNDKGVFTVKFTVKATGGDAYIPAVAAKALSYRVENQSFVPGESGITQGVTSNLAITGNYPLTPNGNYKIPNGTTAAFMLTTTIALPTAGGAGQYRLAVNAINSSKTDVATPTYTYFTSGGPVYVTGYLNLN